MTDDTEMYILPAVPANPDTVGTAEPRPVRYFYPARRAPKICLHI